MEWCETELLGEAYPTPLPETPSPLAEQPLRRDFRPAELELLAELLTREQHPAQTVICREGEPADRLYFLEWGRVSTWVRIDGRQRYRLFASSPGWSFGESALFGELKRTADVVADTHVTLLQLQPERLEASTDPLAVQVRLKLFQNLARVNLERLKQAKNAHPGRARLGDDDGHGRRAREERAQGTDAFLGLLSSLL
jgi:CRP-like cAMP-binding protein